MHRGPSVSAPPRSSRPLCAVINAPGPLHFHPTAHGTPVHGVRTNASRRRLLPAVLPYPGRFVPAYANRIASMRERERDGRNEPGKNERGEILSLYICRRRTIVGKIITVFTAERIHCRASESAPPSKVDRQVSSTLSAKALLTRSKVR